MLPDKKPSGINALCENAGIDLFVVGVGQFATANWPGRGREGIMGGIGDRVEIIQCPACGRQVSNQAQACPGCGQPIKAGGGGEALGIAMLLAPLAGTALLWLWVANMNLLQQPEETAMGIIVCVVLLTACLAAVEAARLDLGGVKWFLAVVLLWIICLPAYLYERSKGGLRNMAIGGTVVAIVFAGSGWLIISAAEAKRGEIRQRLSALSDARTARDARPRWLEDQPDVITRSAFDALRQGIKYKEAVKIIGSEGEELSRAELAGTTTVMVSWKNSNGSNANAMFQNGRLVSKAQFRLK